MKARLPGGANGASSQGWRANMTWALQQLLAERGQSRFNPPDWIAHWQPQKILHSVGACDFDGRPDPETLQVVQDYLGGEEQRLLRTDWHGWIELTTDVEQLWVETERP